jgi:hypothetical protein
MMSTIAIVRYSLGKAKMILSTEPTRSCTQDEKEKEHLDLLAFQRDNLPLSREHAM